MEEYGNIEKLNINELKQRILEIDITEVKNQTNWIEKIKIYEDLKKQSATITKERKVKNEEMNANMEKLLSEYGHSVNEVLKQLSSHYQLQNFNHKKTSRKEFRLFDIQFSKHQNTKKLDLVDNKDFAYILSESEKRFFALAFFLARLRKDLDLDRKVIIFDDPFTSFDLDRKRKISQLISNVENMIGKKPKQVFILTHEERFLYDLKHYSGNENGLYFKIRHDESNQKSYFENYPQEEIDSDEITKLMIQIKDRYDSKNYVVTDLNSCRKVLEHIFKKKYIYKIRRISSFPAKPSVRSFVENLIENTNPDKKEMLMLANELNNDSHDSAAFVSGGDIETSLQSYFALLEKI